MLLPIFKCLEVDRCLKLGDNSLNRHYPWQKRNKKTRLQKPKSSPRLLAVVETDPTPPALSSPAGGRMCVGCGEREVFGHKVPPGPGFPCPSGLSAPSLSHVTTLAGPWELSFWLFPAPSLLGDLSPAWATGVAHPLPWRVCARSGASGRLRCSAHLRFPPAWLRTVSKGTEMGCGGQPAGRQSFLLAIAGKGRWFSLFPPPRLFLFPSRSPPP